MQIGHLAEFIDLAETLSFSETAERLWLTESTLSRHVKFMEQELGVELLERTSRRVRLSKYGQDLLPVARRIVGDYNGWLAQLRDDKALDSASLLIASNYFINDLVAYFCAQNPWVSTQQLSQGDTTDELLSMLTHDECQFVVAIDPPIEDDQIGCLQIASDSFVAVVPSGHKLAGATSINPAQLASERFISFKVGTQGDQRIRQICRQAGFEPNVKFSVDVGSTAARYVRDGLGVTFLQRATIAKMEPQGIECIDLDPPVMISPTLCWRKHKRMSPAAHAFLSFVRDQVAAASDQD